MGELESRSNFAQRLALVTRRWGIESESLLGPAAASPESEQVQCHPESWARRIYPSSTADWREFDRAALSLRCLWELREHGVLVGLGIESDLRWAALLGSVEDGVQGSGAADALDYATLFNDLGKLESTIQALNSVGIDPPADHDEALVLAAEHAGNLVYPGLGSLDEIWAKVWLDGMGCGFNPGMAMQMELPRAGWSHWMQLPHGVRAFHAIHCYVDVLGSGGAHDPLTPRGSLATLSFSSSFFEVCFSGPENFEARLASGLGLSASPRPRLAAAVCARSHGVAESVAAAEAFDHLGVWAREGLEWAWGEDSSVAIQYGPALLAVDASPRGLFLGLEALGRAARLLKYAMEHQGGMANESWVSVANLGSMARLRSHSDSRWDQEGQWVRRKGGWLWEVL